MDFRDFSSEQTRIVALTVVASQAPTAGNTLHASGVVVSGLCHTHRGHAHVQLSRGGQLDEQDVVVDGVAVVLRVLENLSGGNVIKSSSRH